MQTESYEYGTKMNPGRTLTRHAEQAVDAKAAAAIRALGEMFSNPKVRGACYHRYLLVQRASGELVFEQEPFDFLFEQAISKAFGRPKPKRREIRIAL
jgi:hypothetical protein